MTAKQSYHAKNAAKVRADAADRLKDHVITVVREDGLYRHYRCRRMVAGHWTGIDGFDIVTWPGSLCYTGDMGDFLFKRTDDMIGFMSSACRSHGYAAEKCVAHCRDGVEEFRREVLEEILAERKEEEAERQAEEEDYEPKLTDDMIEDILSACEDGEHEVYKQLYETGIWDELPNCESYTQRFLWCLNAIDWFCKKWKNDEVILENTIPVAESPAKRAGMALFLTLAAAAGIACAGLSVLYKFF